MSNPNRNRRPIGGSSNASGQKKEATSQKFQKSGFQREKVFIESQEELDLIDAIQKEEKKTRQRERRINLVKVNDDELVKFNRLRDKQGLESLSAEEYIDFLDAEKIKKRKDERIAKLKENDEELVSFNSGRGRKAPLTAEEYVMGCPNKGYDGLPADEFESDSEEEGDDSEEEDSEEEEEVEKGKKGDKKVDKRGDKKEKAPGGSSGGAPASVFKVGGAASAASPQDEDDDETPEVKAAREKQLARDREQLALVKARRAEAAAKKESDEKLKSQTAQIEAERRAAELLLQDEAAEVIPKLKNREIKEMKPDAMKEALKVRGLSTQGNAKELLKRLTDYEAARTD